MLLRRLKFLGWLAALLAIVLGGSYLFAPQWLLQANVTRETMAAHLEKHSVQAGDTHWVYYEGGQGPTIVHIHPASDAIHVTMRTGTVMSLMQTATGQVFAAYLPAAAVESLIALEEAGALQIGASRRPFTREEIEARLAEVRRRGLARSIDDPVAGVSALSAPVFDHSRSIVLAITLIGPSGSVDASYDGELATTLGKCAALASARLGYIAG